MTTATPTTQFAVPNDPTARPAAGTSASSPTPSEEPIHDAPTPITNDPAIASPSVVIAGATRPPQSTTSVETPSSSPSLGGCGTATSPASAVAPPPDAMPSAPPSRTGDSRDPATTRHVMTIRGVDRLEDEEAWSAITSAYVMSYFDSTDVDPGVFGVNASIVVTGQASSGNRTGGGGGGSESLFQRRFSRRNVRRGRPPERRRLQTEFRNVRVTYEQTSTYKTHDPDTYDGKYVATTPFSTSDGIRGYLVALRGMSPYYDDIESVGSPKSATPSQVDEIRKPPGGGRNAEDPPDGDDGDKEKSNRRISIIIAVCAAGAVAVAIVAVALRKRKKSREEYLQPVGNGPPSSMMRRGNDAAEDGSSAISSPSSSRQLISSAPSRHAIEGNSSSSSADDNAMPMDSSSDIIMLHVIAPAGKLGVIVDTPQAGGPAYVCEIKKDTCPIADQIQLEDKVIAVDDIDVQRMSAVTVSRLLAGKSRQAERKITVLREVGPGRGDMMPEEGAVVHAATYDDESPRLVATTSDVIQEKEERQLDIIAPKGKLGVILVIPEPPAPPGPAYVFDVRDDSVLFGKIRLNDKIVAVDDEDVSRLSAVEVSKLLGKKSSRPRRKITVLREVDGEDDEDEEPGGTGPNAVSESDDESDAAGKSENRFHIMAPAGRLGVLVDSPVGGGLVFVSEVKDDSPILGKVHVGDKVVCVDDEDVSEMKAIQVSMILGSKSKNAQRKITVVR